MKTILLILILGIVTLSIYPQESTIINSDNNQNTNIENISANQSTGNKILFKDEDGNNLFGVQDEGTIGSIWLSDSIGPPSNTVNKIYNVDGSLHFNGLELTGTCGWIDKGSFIRLNTETDKVGIGTNSPTVPLHVVANDGVIFEGEAGGNPLNPGAGRRMHWYPQKSAFRAGKVVGNEWDDSNIGGSSTAFGDRIIASGSGSFAVGQISQATGLLSIAMGVSSIASGDWSTAIGNSVTATGLYSTAIGNKIDAESYSSTVIGRYNVGGGSLTSWVDTDPLFEIGNGTSTTSSNALTVLKSGKIGIGIGAETPIDIVEIRSLFGEDALCVRIDSDVKLKVKANGGTTIGVHNLNTTPVDGLYVHGDILYGGALTSSSDKRFKLNIVPINNAIHKLQSIRGVYYKWRKDEFPERNFTDEKQIGVIAQEVEREFPEIVKTNNDGYKSIDYAKLTPILIEAVKEQQILISEIKTHNDELQKAIVKNNNLSNEVKQLKQVLNKLIQEKYDFELTFNE